MTKKTALEQWRAAQKPVLPLYGTSQPVPVPKRVKPIPRWLGPAETHTIPGAHGIKRRPIKF